MKSRTWLMLSILAAAISWLYVGTILTPWNQHRGEAVDGIKTQMGDLYSPWMGARELLLHHRNPYSPEVSHEIQVTFYGHAVDQTAALSAGKIINEQRFAYPLYTVFLLAPTVFARFAEVRLGAQIGFAFLTGVSVLLGLDILRWRLSRKMAIALVLFVLSSPQIVQGLRFEQLALVVGFFLIAAAWSVRRQHFTTAGFLLAFSTIKPQMVLLPLCWFAIWATGDWRKRWRIAAGFFVTLAALVLAGEMLLPGWPRYFLAGLAAYRRYAPPTSLLVVGLGHKLGEAIAGLIVLILLCVAWRNRTFSEESPQFSATLAVFLMGAIVAFPLLTPFNQVMMILPVLLVIKDWSALPRVSRAVFFATVTWPWVVSLVLIFLPTKPDYPSQMPLLPSFMVLFFPLFVPLILASGQSTPRVGKTGPL